MILHIGFCPYCSSEVAVDVCSSEVLFNPDALAPRECTHLVYALVDIELIDPEPDAPQLGMEGETWLAERGRGLREIWSVPSTEDQVLAFYLIDLGMCRLPATLLPSSEYRLVGGNAAEREEARPGSSFILAERGDGVLWRIRLDAWVVFAPAAELVHRQVRDLALRRLAEQGL